MDRGASVVDAEGVASAASRFGATSSADYAAYQTSMKEFAREENLKRALLFGALLTLLSIPRLVEVDLALPPPGLILFTFGVMTFASGAAMAWQHHGGMAGLFPGKRRTALGTGWAVIAGLVLLSAFFFIDPLLPRELAANAAYQRWGIVYPENEAEVISRILWSAGFQTMFFTAAAMAVFCRVTRNVWVSLLIVLCGRMLITAYRLTALELQAIIPPFLLITALFAIVSCLLFARYGLIPAAACAATIESRHFARLAMSPPTKLGSFKVDKRGRIFGSFSIDMGGVVNQAPGI